jgi:hypothetical protein
MALRLSPKYRPRDPTQTVLYQVLDQHLASFIEEVEATDRPLPGFVRRELEGLLRCGRIEWGFARQFCPVCTFERLIGLPCRGRTCPSCQGKRMIAGAARLVDHIIPKVPVRQWVCGFAPSLRFVLAFDHELFSKVIAIFVGEVMRWQRHVAKRELGLSSVARAHGAAVTAIHRSGGSLNLQPHLHSALLDGVYVTPSDDISDLWRTGRKPEFRALPAPTRSDLREIAARVYAKTKRELSALGLDWEEDASAIELEGACAVADEPLLRDCAEASVRGVGLLGEQAGQPLFSVVPDRFAVPADLAHLIDEHDACEHPGGFNIHAARRVSAADRSGLERMCRYLLHPPFSHDRLQWTDDGNVRLRYTRPWRNGVDSMVVSPHNLIARLVPLVPRPGTHQLRYHGALGARSELRPLIIPDRPTGVVQLPMFDRYAEPTPRARQKTTQEQQPETVPDSPSENVAESETPPAGPLSAPENPPLRPPPLQKLRPMTWAEAMERMADYNLDDCPWCGARLAPVIVVLHAEEVHRTLVQRGLLDPIPPLTQAPARGPPVGQLELPFLGASIHQRSPVAA